MLIKRAESSGLHRLAGKLTAGRWLLGIVTLLLLIGVVLGSIFYGMVLVKTGQSISLREWATGLAHAKLSVIPNYLDGLTAKPERIEIDIKFKDHQKLDYKRQQALREGILISEDRDWVPATIRYQGAEYKADLRLKGDLSDHWKRANFWSFKIKMKGEHSLFGMKNFAIQDPRTRCYLNEWIIYQLAKRLDLISLRYDFIDVTINGKHEPIYALEENFEKRLIEHNERREGPILRYDQWFYWLDNPGLEAELAGASISVYQEGRYSGEGGLVQEFEAARTAMDLYRQGKLPASKVFNLKSVASFLALADLTGYYHATHIDNLKFYYNPVTSLIEPIGYDFNDIVPLARAKRGVVGEQLIPLGNLARDPMDWRAGLFLDEQFYLEYVRALRRISAEKFLDDFFADIQKEMDTKLSILHKSNPWYNFENKTVLYENQEYIRKLLNPERSLQIYFHAIDSVTHEAVITVHNIHVLSSELLALTHSSGLRLVPTERTAIPGYFASDPIRYVEVRFALPKNSDTSQLSSQVWTLEYRIQGTDQLRSEKVYPWSAINEMVLANDFMRRPPNVERFDWLRTGEEDKTITVLPGKHSLSEPLILPAGYTVRAGEGAELDLIKSAMILSYSPLYWSGSERNPIRIISSDSTGQGLTVLASGQPSTLLWVMFDNLSNPVQGKWSLTGAVTFYESPVTMSHCRFANNRSEDCLNTVRTEFKIEHTAFVQTQADAFDADFCIGGFENVTFLQCGNDAIDISGSTVNVANVMIDSTGDKGLSAGENSQMIVRNVTIQNAELAVASKDRSDTEIQELVIRNCRVGFTAYQKKPEFGPGHIRVTGMQLTNSQQPYLIEEGSSLTIDGKVIPPGGKQIKDLLYGVKYGKASK
jgi:hypothetical protein